MQLTQYVPLHEYLTPAQLTLHNPLLNLLTLYALLGTLIVYIPPHRRAARLAATLAYAATATHFYHTLHPSLVPPRALNWIVLTGVALVLYANTALLITPAIPPPSARTTAQKARWVVREWLSNPRGEATARTKAFLRGRPDWVPPSRAASLLYHAARPPFFFGAMRAFAALELRVYWQRLVAGDYNAEREVIVRRLFQAGWREWAIRAWLPLQYLVPTYCALSGMYSIFALVGIGLVGDDHRRWRPLFGDIRDVCTLRRFWSQWWQQYHRRAFVAHGKLVAQKVLRLRDPTAVRCVVALVSFALSGFMHGLSIKLQGRRCDPWPVTNWYMQNGVVCVLEDCFLVWWRMSGLERRVPLRVQWGLGRVWVYLFLWWSLPKLMFPNIGCTLPDMEDLQ